MVGGAPLTVMIHACPQRMWYVDGFLIPSLRAQGVENIQIWNDSAKDGNLTACMRAFASCAGDGGTWHLQDDVLIARDFAKRARAHDRGVVFGFCCQYFLDNPACTGQVYVPDAWHSFQCVRIPDAYARECAEWYFSGAWKDADESGELLVLQHANKGDDSFFRHFLLDRHGLESVENLKPNLVEHVDVLIGGSVLHPWRDYFARAHFWDDAELVEALRRRLQARV